MGFPGGPDSKEFTCNVGDLGLIPGSGRSLEKEIGAHSSIPGVENPVDRGVWRAAVHGVAKSQIGVSNYPHFHYASSFDRSGHPGQWGPPG